MIVRRPVQIYLLPLCALILAACSTFQPPSNGPRGSESIYPLLYNADDSRISEANVAVNRLFQTSAAQNQPTLRPITLTLESLPANPSQPIYIPKLGTSAVMTEDETRESLRRFIKDWQDLIGADPSKLSLVERVDQPDGIKLATYEQRPFRYPIRGNFGKLNIRFTTDRRVVSLSSTCIPDADRIQTMLAGVTAKLKPEDATNQVVTNSISYVDAGGTQQTFRATANQLNPRELVTFVRISPEQSNTLDFHIAWEIQLSGAPIRNVYVDAVNGEIIGAI